MLCVDPPDHTRLRSLVSKAFTPVAVERLRPRIEAIVAGLLDRVAGAGAMDVVEDLAYPLPFTVICEPFGVPEAGWPSSGPGRGQWSACSTRWSPPRTRATGSAGRVVSMCVLLLVAGHETTVNLIANGTLALLRHPEARARLQAEPALAGGAVEELLRYDCPV